MNRAEHRKFARMAKKRGISEEAANAYLVLKALGVQSFKEDDKVRLNVKRIMAGKDYEKMNPKYKEFVESNERTIFTAHIERQTLTSLKEQPEWLFWNGNLIAVETAETKEQE